MDQPHRRNKRRCATGHTGTVCIESPSNRDASPLREGGTAFAETGGCQAALRKRAIPAENPTLPPKKIATVEKIGPVRCE